MTNEKNRSSAFERKKLAGLELNDLLINELIPRNLFERSRLSSGGTPIYDINGTVLFYRMPIRKGKKTIGYTDVTTAAEMNSPVLSVVHGTNWNAKNLLSEAKKVAKKKQRDLKYDTTRFVAYSYPKIAIQFLKRTKEVLMLELGSWEKVPKIKQGGDNEKSYGFERWSYLDNLSDREKKKNIKAYDKRIKKWNQLTNLKKPERGFDSTKLIVKNFKNYLKKKDIIVKPITFTRELHYSGSAHDHSPCYELRSQLTNVWCVGASVQMLLDFYRYNYTQVRLATELGLGTLASPNGLWYGNENDVVTTLETLTSNALDATLNFSPTYTEFVAEINANRPLISFIPGHSRTVAGYSYGVGILGSNTKLLLVYDPWPPSTDGTTNTGGTITRWENYNTSTYRCTFTANLTMV